ncbi:MAG: shikimate kinase AroK [Nevskia sp.]|nr:shikimate kinase AroK [Nevskia sp.]MCK9384358.1 shikimate kinase AroK [Nevskia sp.]
MSKQNNIFLIGPMGAGKTTVGRRLADARGMEFIDSDQDVEARTGVNITFIFEKEGEAGFRRRERSAIANLTERENLVLSTGGGAILDPDNRRWLSERGFVVYLYAGVEQQIARTERTDNRPLLQGGDRRDTLQRLFLIRDPLYREIADLVINTDGRNARTLAREIEDKLVRAAGVR